MSVLSAGYYVPEQGAHRYCPLVDVRELADAGHQHILARHYHSSIRITCACGLPGDQSLYVRSMPNGRFTLVRRNIRTHSAMCWRGLSGDGADGEVVLRASLFRNAGAPVIVGRDGYLSAESTEQLRKDYYRFGRFCSHALADANVASFVRQNSRGASCGFAQYTVAVLLEELNRAFSAIRFREGSALDAARSEGGDLVFGFILSSAQQFHSPAGVVENIYIWRESGLYLSTVVMLRDAWSDAIAGIQVHGRPQGGPYLFIAVKTSRGHVYRIRLFPCHTDGFSFAVNDSEYERNFFSFLLQKNLCVYKPVLGNDTRRIFTQLSLWGSYSVPEIPYRPDYLVFEKRKDGSWRCIIVELRGYRLGARPDYDIHLQRKAAFFRALHPQIIYAERNGWEYHDKANFADDITWREMAVGWLGDTPAAQDWRNNKFL